jgi:hypothetical protein
MLARSLLDEAEEQFERVTIALNGSGAGATFG